VIDSQPRILRNFDLNDFTSGVKTGRNLIGCVVQVVETFALKYILAPFLQLFTPLKSTTITERTRH